MGFLTPLAFAFAALSIPILILYMLKLRRRDMLVSSTLLWQRLLRDREANAPWQRLRANLLLLLQLLILALLTLALARPFVPTRTVVSGGNLVILLDASASMQARDIAPTRFGAAQRVVREIVTGLSADDTATLIVVGPQPQVATGGDPAALRRALEDTAPTSGPADWEAAFALAAGLAGAGDTQVVIVSDGALPETLPPLLGQVRFVGVGGEGNNLAITALAVREGAAGPQAFLRVNNYGDADAGPVVEFYADGALFDARRLSVAAHSSADLTLADLPYDLRVLEARLTTQDALALDDVAWAVYAPPASRRVLLVSAGNLFLERALGALPGIELVRLSPDQPLPAGAYDLTIFDGVVSDTLSSGNLWLIAPPTSLSLRGEIEGGGIFTATTITRVVADDPLLRYVDLSEVHILQARAVEPPPAACVLVEAAGGPLLFVTERPGGGRLAVLTFDLHDSDLPLQIAFPILTANLVNWLAPRGGIDLPAVVRPGDPVPLQPAPEAVQVRVTAPDGTQTTFPVGESPPVLTADRLGVYRVEQSGQSDTVLPSVVPFAVNLFDEAESDIAPREVVRIGQMEVRLAAREEQGWREFWPWLAGAAVCVLAVEWWVYHIGTRRPGDKETGSWRKPNRIETSRCVNWRLRRRWRSW